MVGEVRDSGANSVEISVWGIEKNQKRKRFMIYVSLKACLVKLLRQHSFSRSISCLAIYSPSSSLAKLRWHSRKPLIFQD